MAASYLQNMTYALLSLPSKPLYFKLKDITAGKVSSPIAVIDQSRVLCALGGTGETNVRIGVSCKFASRDVTMHRASSTAIELEHDQIWKQVQHMRSSDFFSPHVFYKCGYTMGFMDTFALC